MPDASVDTIIHTCEATINNGSATHSEGLVPLKLHKTRRTIAQRSVARGRRSPDGVCFSEHMYASVDRRNPPAMCSGLCTSAPAKERLAQRFGGAISIEIEVQRGAGNT